MAHTVRGADVVVQVLKRAGVKCIFTLSGNHIMPVFDALLDAGIDLVHTRHEAAAVHMADGWARLTGEAGIALVSGGPAHCNAISALYTAQMSESPVLLLSGHSPNDQLGYGAFQEVRQAEIAGPLTKASWVSASADALGLDVARAIRIARMGRPGPVHLSMPIDALESRVIQDAAPSVETWIPETLPLADVEAEATLERLAAASRPLILAGPACLTRAGRDHMRALEEATGIPVVGMESPRGINDPSMGAFADITVQSDLVLLIGKRMDYTLQFGRQAVFGAACKFIHIDAEDNELQRTRRTLGGRLVSTAIADAFSAIASLTTMAPKREHLHQAWLAEVQAAIGFRSAGWSNLVSKAPGKLHPIQMSASLQALLDSDPESVMVADGGEFGQWAQACLTAPNRLINGPAGAIGSAIPLALAARIARPTAPIVAFMGDGTFGFHMAEMDTAVRYRLPFIAVVGNDARWNAEYQIQLKTYGQNRLIGCELLPTRYDLLTASLGGHGEYVTKADDIAPAVDRAYRSKRPSCLNLMIEGVAAPLVRRGDFVKVD